MSRSPYYIDVREWRALADTLLAVLDPRMVPLWLLALLGGWAIGRKGEAGPRWAWIFSALAVANVALYWLVIPYRTQQRFMLQAMGLAAVPLAITIDRAAWLRASATALLALHLLTPQVWPIAWAEGSAPPWDFDPRIPNVTPSFIVLPVDLASLRAAFRVPSGLTNLGGTLMLGLGAFPAAWLWLRIRGPGDLGRLALAIAATLGLAGAGFAWFGGFVKFAMPNFPDYYEAWTELDLRAGPAGVRVAYAGTNIPYYLMGSGLRNEVRYVNVDAHRDWLLHDYHARARELGEPETWPDPFPGWDRARPDYDAWLANLRAEAIDVLVVARVNPAQGAQNVADREWFPIERGWAESHPDDFRPIFGVDPPDPKMRLYRVLPAKIPRGSTDRGARPH